MTSGPDMVNNSGGSGHPGTTGTLAALTARTMSVPDAGREYLGLGRDASYEAAKRGEIPFIQIGRLKRVPIIAMEKMLERVGDQTG